MWHAGQRPAGRQAALRVRGKLAGWHTGYVSRVPFYSRTLLWITAAICAALLIFTGSEAWVNFQMQRQIEQARVQNAWLRQDTATTERRAAWAESPGTIEDEARALGYARPGEQAVVVAASPPAQPAAASMPTPAPAPAPTPTASASPGTTASTTP
jgi:cell division protein FtsB